MSLTSSLIGRPLPSGERSPLPARNAWLVRASWIGVAGYAGSWLLGMVGIGAVALALVQIGGGWMAVDAIPVLTPPAVGGSGWTAIAIYRAIRTARQA